MVERNYELRTLCADDIFPMVKIISKIGIDDIANCFDAKEMSEVMEAMKPAEDEESEVGTAEKANELLTQQIGIRVVMKLVGLLMKNLGNIKGDLYKFLAGVSGMEEQEIAKLPLGTFTQMIIDIFKKEEFGDFFQVVSGLVK